MNSPEQSSRSVGSHPNTIPIIPSSSATRSESPTIPDRPNPKDHPTRATGQPLVIVPDHIRSSNTLSTHQSGRAQWREGRRFIDMSPPHQIQMAIRSASQASPTLNPHTPVLIKYLGDSDPPPTTSSQPNIHPKPPLSNHNHPPNLNPPPPSPHHLPNPIPSLTHPQSPRLSPPFPNISNLHHA